MNKQIITNNPDEIIKRIKLKGKALIDSEKKKNSLEAMRIFLTEFLPTPRPSHNEDAIREKFRKYAQQQRFIYEEDTYGNAACIVPATSGFENIPAIALQFHMDMVPAKEYDSKTDPAVNGVKPVLIQDSSGKQWIRSADKTSLGADNGAGAAVIWQVAKDIQDASYSHGPLIILATREEETGMIGAKNLSFNPKGNVQKQLENTRYFMNADGENEGKVCIGCQGGEMLTLHIPIQKEDVSANLRFITIKVTGLQGGHSGINAERVSANTVLLQWLGIIKENSAIRISEVKGGEFDNAIATFAEATIGIPKEKVKQIQEELNQHSQVDQEPMIKFTVQEAEKPKQIMTQRASQDVFTILSELANRHGVSEYFKIYDEKMPVRSLNFAIIDTTKPKDQIKLMSRLGKIEEHGKYLEELKRITNPIGAEIIEDSWYAPWTPDEQNQLPKIAGKVYQKTFGRPLAFEVTRGGLELGPIHEKFPKAEKIVLAITIIDPHSANEQVEIQSIADCYIFLSSLIKNLSRKLITEEE